MISWSGYIVECFGYSGFKKKNTFKLILLISMLFQGNFKMKYAAHIFFF